MSKRLTDTEIWNKEWYQLLPIKLKCLLKYSFDKCDCAGILEPNYREISFYIGETISKSDFEEINLRKTQFTFLENGKFFVVDFISFHYKCEIKELNPNFSVHKGVIEKLNKNNVFETLNQPLDNPYIVGLQNKNKNIYTNKDINKLFEEFYKLYPRKESKQHALKAYEKALKDGADPQSLLDGVKRYISKISKENTERRFVKHPATWLNQGCWDDDYTTIEQQKSQGAIEQTAKYIAKQEERKKTSVNPCEIKTKNEALNYLKPFAMCAKTKFQRKLMEDFSITDEFLRGDYATANQ